MSHPRRFVIVGSVNANVMSEEGTLYYGADGGPGGGASFDHEEGDVLFYTGLLDADNREILEHDTVEFIHGPYKGQQAEVVWNPKGMWSLKWGTEINQAWLANPGSMRVTGNTVKP